jgi:hypothetical protein
VTRSGATVHFYKDGTELGTGSTMGGGFGGQISSLCAYADNTFPIDLDVDDVRYYPTALTSGQIAILYALNPDIVTGGAQTFAPTVALVAPADQTIVTATIAGTAVDVLLLEDGSDVLLEDGGHILLDARVGTAVVFPPTIAAGALTVGVIASGSTLSAPTVAFVVTLPHRASTATLTGPTVATGIGNYVGTGTIVIAGPIIHAIGTNESIQPPSIGTGRPIERPRPPEPLVLPPIIGRGVVCIAGPIIRATGLVLPPTPAPVLPEPEPVVVVEEIPALVGRAVVITAASVVVGVGTATRVERLAPRRMRVVGHSAARVRGSQLVGCGCVEEPLRPVVAVTSAFDERTRQLLLDDDEFLLLEEVL